MTRILFFYGPIFVRNIFLKLTNFFLTPDSVSPQTAIWNYFESILQIFLKRSPLLMVYYFKIKHDVASDFQTNQELGCQVDWYFPKCLSNILSQQCHHSFGLIQPDDEIPDIFECLNDKTSNVSFRTIKRECQYIKIFYIILGKYFFWKYIYIYIYIYICL